jgi:hypothetical protein
MYPPRLNVSWGCEILEFQISPPSAAEYENDVDHCDIKSRKNTPTFTFIKLCALYSRTPRFIVNFGTIIVLVRKSSLGE